MRRIAIVGAGQSGLQLALGLLAEGYDVTLLSDRTAEEIRRGRVLSSQVMFGPTLRLERELGLHLWEDSAPRIAGQRVTRADPPGTAAVAFSGLFDDYAQSVDQRIKAAAWLELFEARGGRLEHRAADTGDLARLADTHDLTIVAAGRGELARIFPTDTGRSPFDRPQRALACVYLHHVAPRPGAPGAEVRVTVIPDGADVILMPALTLSGPCDILLWEAAPGGPFDHWRDVPAPEAMLARSLDLLRTYAPWEAELLAGAEPTDGRAALVGAVTPTVRHPVAELSADTAVLGMADTVVVNDPITGQGSNNAARCADVYLRSILDRGAAPFDSAWMRSTFDAFWEHARYVTAFTRLMLAPPAHAQRAMLAAVEHPSVAHRFVNGYTDPADYRHWLLDPEATDAYLATVTDR